MLELVLGHAHLNVCVAREPLSQGNRNEWVQPPSPLRSPSVHVREAVARQHRLGHHAAEAKHRKPTVLELCGVWFGVEVTGCRNAGEALALE